MILQRVLKGIPGVTQADAERELHGGYGVVCNWWRQVDPLPNKEVPRRLTPDNLLRHLSAYDDIDPATGRPFGERTPFISTTAGTVERDAHAARNLTFNAFVTALSFATRNFRESGAIYFAYLAILGRPAVRLREFAEETRDLHQWTDFQPYHPEGEIVAKIEISSPHIERVEGYDGPAALNDLQNGQFPRPQWTALNSRYHVPPEDICNIRDAL